MNSPLLGLRSAEELYLTTLCWLLHGGLKEEKNIFFSLYEAEDLTSCLWSLWHLIADKNNYHQIDWNLCLLFFYGLIIDFNLRSEWTREWFPAHASFVPYCTDSNYDWGQWLWSIWNFKNQLSDKNYIRVTRVWAKMVRPLPTIRYQEFVTVFWCFKSPFSVRQERFNVPVPESPRLAS